MTFMKIALFTIVTASLTALAPAAYADFYPGKTSTISKVNGSFSQLTVGGATLNNDGDRLFGGSETASFFYKKGVKKFEDGNLEKAEIAFKATLRAQGSDTLDKLALHYLSYINNQQGDVTEAMSYAEVYLDLSEK